MIVIKKISLSKLEAQDFAVLSDACARYAEDLGSLKEKENQSQQHIHYAILQVVRFDLIKKMTSRSQSKTANFNLEVYQAFVMYDALQHYSNFCNNQLDQAILRRIIFQLFSDLPNTADKDLSIKSQLNFSH